MPRPLHLLAPALAFGCAAGLRLAAQPAPAPAPASASAAEPVQLNPFEVRADSDTSYSAVNSNSITQFNAALNNLPVSADIFDEAFMSDVGATSVEGLIQGYSAGAGFAGMNAGSAASVNQPGDAAPANSYTQLRGFATPTMQRDSLLFVGRPGNPGSTAGNFTSNFDLERVEIINGPQSLLYDGGGPGGVINVVSKEAHFDAPDFATVAFRTDQDGTKYGTVDYQASADWFALRFAGVDASDDTRRIDIGDQLNGEYLQLAAQAARSTFRLSLEQTYDRQINSAYLNLTSTSDPNFSGDNGDDLGYLVATHQTGMLGGQLNWGNVNSLTGDLTGDTVLDEFATLSVDTTWTSSFSTQISTGLSRFDDDESNGTYSFYSPNASSNTLPGNWTLASGSSPLEDTEHPYLGKALRASGLLAHDWFGAADKSQTIFGADYIGIRGAIVPYDYYEADSNWNLVTGASGTAGLGRTLIPKQSWTIDNGPVLYPLFYPGSPRVTINGVNYLREYQNPINTALISPSNPLGTAIANGASITDNNNLSDGAYAIDYSQWFNGKLDTMVGLRLQKLYDTTAEPLRTGLLTPAYLIEQSNRLLYNFGADYHVLPWLTPYFSISTQANMPPNETTDPAGNVVGPEHSRGEEVGLKVSNADSTLSGSIAAYDIQATNAEFITSSTLSNDINPSGLNGKYSVGGGGSTAFSTNATSQGIQLTLTSNPVKEWRLRLSAAVADGTMQGTKTYPQLYNDQFYENASGDVTYADGTVVYVPATFNSKALTVTSTTAGAMPLTVAILSNPSSSYYANPNLVSGQISTSSNAAKVLETVDPVHGPILTGVAGLPISDLQLLPSEIPGMNIPGAINLVEAGDDTTGYPEFSVNLTSVYTFSSGWLKGLKLGGTGILGWEDRSYYYYPNGIGASTGPNSSPRSLFYLPDIARFDGIIGYSRKFRRVTLSTQLNIYNMFNHYAIVIFPNQVTGWTSASGLTANFDQQPRMYAWTTALSF